MADAQTTARTFTPAPRERAWKGRLPLVISAAFAVTAVTVVTSKCCMAAWVHASMPAEAMPWKGIASSSSHTSARRRQTWRVEFTRQF